MKICKKLHLAYADAARCGCVRGPRTEFEGLLYGMRPITGDASSPATLQTRLRVTGEANPERRRTIVDAHRYLPRAPQGTPPKIARAYHASVDEAVPWVPGPPPFIAACLERQARRTP